MKKLFLLISFTFSFLFSDNINAQDCQIFDLAANVSPCNDGLFYLILQFDHTNTGNDGYNVHGGGVNYGNHPYSENPLTLGPFEGNGQNMEFVVNDIQHPDCSDFILVEAPDCNGGDCHIYDLVVETLPCNDNGTFGIAFDFQYENVNPAGFDLSINGQNYGFYQYEDLPITIENFPSNGNNVQYINVGDNDNPDCHDAVEFEVPNCGGDDCLINGLNANVSPCNDGLFYLILQFDHTNTGNDGYNVHGGGVNYGNHPYSENPLTLGPFEGNGQNMEFVVNDIQHPDCSDFILVEAPDCNGGDCHIYDLVVETLPCNDNGTFGIAFDFQYENVNPAGFDLSINGQNYGFYQYEDLPITIENFPSNGNNVQSINVGDNDNPDCHDAVEFEVPNCGGDDCLINGLNANVSPCNDGLFYLILQFDHTNTGNDGYNVHGGGVNYGNHPYSENPLTLGPFEGNGQNMEFVVNDIQHPDCSDFILVEAPDCNGGDCHIYDLVVETLPCNDNGTFGIAFDFQYENVNPAGFDLSINGQNYGFYQYEDLPITIENFPSNGNNVQSINVGDNDNPDCHDAVEFEVPNCGGDDCLINGLSANVSPCNDGLFYLILQFDHTNTGNDGYNVHGGGVNYGNHPYSENPLTLGPFEGNGQNMEFVVNDIQHPDCSDFILVEAPDCNGGDCHIYDLVVETLPCNDNGTFGIAFDFQYENVNPAGFDLSINGQNYGFYQYEDLPITIENFPSNGNNVQSINVGDNDNPDCHDAVEFEVPNCGGDDCLINGLNANVSPCNDGLFYIILQFDHTNTGNDGYNVHGGGVNYGNHPYSENPLTLGPFEGNGQNMEFVVNDIQHPDCSDFILVEAPDCNGGDCHIYDLTATATECTPDGNFFVTLNFESDNVSGEGFTIHGNGNNYGEFNYNIMPVVLGPFPGDGGSLEFAVNDIVNENCGDAIEVEAPLCEPGINCEIGEIEINVFPCDPNGMFFVTIDFDHENTSLGFTVHGNGNDYGSFAYNTLPLALGPFEGDGETIYELGVTDLLFEDCHAGGQFGPVECPTGTDNLQADDIKIAVSENEVIVSLSEHITGSQLNIYNTAGQRIQTFEDVQNNTYINTSAFPTGIYIIEIRSEKGFVAKRFLKR